MSEQGSRELAELERIPQRRRQRCARCAKAKGEVYVIVGIKYRGTTHPVLKQRQITVCGSCAAFIFRQLAHWLGNVGQAA